MNIPAMLLPHKHVRFGGSLVAIAGYLRLFLLEPRTLDEIWAALESAHTEDRIKPTFTQMVLAVDLLFAINQVLVTKEGRVALVQDQSLPIPQLDSLY